MAEYTIPNKLNYTVVAGATVWIARKVNDVVQDYYPVGNLAEDCTLGFELERWTHFTNLYGVDTRDRNPVIKKSMNFKCVIDELVRENLEFAMGSSGRLVNQTLAVRCLEKVTLVAGAGSVNGGAAIVAVDTVLPNSGESTYDQGPSGDYDVNEATGAITLPAGSTIGQTDTITVYYRVNKTCMKYPIMDSPNIAAALQFISRKSTTNELGYNLAIDIPNVDISLDGDITLMKTEAIKATLMCQALADATNPSGALGYYYTFTD